MRGDTNGMMRGMVLLGLSVLLLGCPPKRKMVTPEEVKQPQEAVQAPQDAAASAEASAGEPALEVGTQWATAPALEPIYFAYMNAELRPEAREKLKKNAGVLKIVLRQAPSVQVRVEGHCDERGTLEYNLALGQRRANAVRAYYTSFGIPKTSLLTISYGEERPVCQQSAEECWAQNRRGETTLKSASGPIRIPMNKLSMAH